MDHHFVTAMEKALGWDGPRELGAAFARGTIEDLNLLDRLLNPRKLLDLVMRRSVTTPSSASSRTAPNCTLAATSTPPSPGGDRPSPWPTCTVSAR